MYDCNIEYGNDKTVSIGQFTECKWCHAKKWKDENQGLCCSSGKVQLPIIKQLSDILHCLLMNNHPESQHFLANIRKYILFTNIFDPASIEEGQ